MHARLAPEGDSKEHAHACAMGATGAGSTVLSVLARQEAFLTSEIAGSRQLQKLLFALVFDWRGRGEGANSLRQLAATAAEASAAAFAPPKLNAVAAAAAAARRGVGMHRVPRRDGSTEHGRGAPSRPGWPEFPPAAP